MSNEIQATGNGDQIIRQAMPKAVVLQERQIDIAAEMKKSAQQINEQNQALEAEPQPEAAKERVQLSANLGLSSKTIFDAEAGNTNILNQGGNSFLQSDGISIGGEVKFPKGTYVKGAIQTGVDLPYSNRYTGFAEIEAGYEFDIGHNMGLDLSLKAQGAQESASRGQLADLRASGNVAFTYKNNKGLKVSAGVEAGAVARWDGRAQIDVTTVRMEDRTREYDQYNGKVEITNTVETSETRRNDTYVNNNNNEISTYTISAKPELETTTNQEIKKDLVPGRNPAVITKTEEHTRIITSEAHHMPDGTVIDCGTTIEDTWHQGPVEITGEEFTHVVENYQVEVPETHSEVITIKRKPKPFVSPKISVEQKIGNTNFTVTGNISLNEVNVGLKYNFDAKKK